MRRPPAAVALVAVVFGGCLPSSQRELDRSLSATDSASVALAAEAPLDTLAVVWTARAPEADPMVLPTSLGWLGDGVAVVETQGGSVRSFDGGGRYLGRADLAGGAFPYLAGVRGDTVVVLERGADRLAWVVPREGVVRSVPVPPGATAAVATDSLLAVRLGGGATGARSEVVVLDERGAEVARIALPGAPWRSAGFLRSWGDSLLALSGYRPVVDVVTEAGADTLALRGFASPQLARSAQFARGDVDEPPLLTSSAAALGDRLFVLNLRGDHVRVDIYDRGGTIARVAVSPRPWAPTDAVPVDLAVRPGSNGTVDLAVLMSRAPGLLQSPEARVVLYRWTPPPAPVARAGA